MATANFHIHIKVDQDKLEAFEKAVEEFRARTQEVEEASARLRHAMLGMRDAFTVEPRRTNDDVIVPD